MPYYPPSDALALTGTTLFDSTLGADGTSIDTGAGGFSSDFGHLVLICLLRTSQAAILSSVNVTFNNDTGSNYDDQAVRGRDATASAADNQGAAAFGINAPGASAAAGVFGGGLVIVPAYSQTTAEKVAIMMGYFADEAATGGDAGTRAAHWRSTVAISRVTFTTSGYNMLAGSRLSVYGIG